MHKGDSEHMEGTKDPYYVSSPRYLLDLADAPGQQ